MIRMRRTIVKVKIGGEDREQSKGMKESMN